MIIVFCLVCYTGVFVHLLNLLKGMFGCILSGSFIGFDYWAFPNKFYDRDRRISPLDLRRREEHVLRIPCIVRV